MCVGLSRVTRYQDRNRWKDLLVNSTSAVCVKRCGVVVILSHFIHNEAHFTHR